MGRPERRVLVIGGTGILRPAVEALLRDGRAVTALSRSEDRLAQLPTGVCRLRGDLADPAGLRAALATLPVPPVAALAYLPGSPAAVRAAVTVLRPAVAGPVLAILTSGVAAPGPDGRSADPDLAAVVAGLDPGGPGELHVLVLGWVPPSAAGPARWHTREEISAAALAALAALDDPRPRRLGVLRPWTQRPG
jgi:hypothetical protein